MTRHFFVREENSQWHNLGSVESLGFRDVEGHETELCVILRDMLSANGYKAEVEIRTIES